MMRIGRFCQILAIPLALMTITQYRGANKYTQEVIQYGEAVAEWTIFGPKTASRRESDDLRIKAQRIGEEIASETDVLASLRVTKDVTTIWNEASAALAAPVNEAPTQKEEEAADGTARDAVAEGAALGDETEEHEAGYEETAEEEGFEEDPVEAVEETAVEEAETPVEETPVEEVETPVEETPVEEAETPVEETPVGETVDLALEKRDKPTLILHIGAPKTATTSLQMDLTKMAEELESDGYHYTGRWLNPYRNDRDILFLNRTYEPILDYTEDMFAERERSKEENIALFREELAKYLPEGKDIIISEEGLCGRYKDQSYYEELKDIVGEDWEILIIAGYRYFHQWLPSAQFQKNRMDQRNPWKITWPAVRGIHEGTGGKVPELIFPDLVHTWEEKNAHFTKNIVEHINGVLPLRIYNIHDKSSSVRTHFMCDMLPNAVNTCKKSKELDSQDQTTAMNLREDIIHTYYDILTTTAASHGLIDMDAYLRKDIREAAQVHNEEVLNQTYRAFELICPSDADYEAYLQESLDHERVVYGEEVAATMEEAHREDFREKVESNLYCNVDAEAVLEHQEWKDFFAQYSKEPAETM